MVLSSIDDPGLPGYLADGKIAVIPTDTVYGLVCRAADQAAVGRLYKLKDRVGKPGTIIAATLEQLEAIGIKRRYLKAVEQFWPNPLSVILPDDAAHRYLDQGTGSLAVRVTADTDLRRLLLRTGALLSTSANAPGEPPAGTVAAAQAYFGDAVDIYVEGPDLTNRPPSTIIRVIDDAIEVVRQGAVTIKETGEIIP